MSKHVSKHVSTAYIIYKKNLDEKGRVTVKFSLLSRQPRKRRGEWSNCSVIRVAYLSQRSRARPLTQVGAGSSLGAFEIRPKFTFLHLQLDEEGPSHLFTIGLWPALASSWEDSILVSSAWHTTPLTTTPLESFMTEW